MSYKMFMVGTVLIGGLIGGLGMSKRAPGSTAAELVPNSPFQIDPSLYPGGLVDNLDGVVYQSDGGAWYPWNTSSQLAVCSPGQGYFSNGSNMSCMYASVTQNVPGIDGGMAILEAQGVNTMTACVESGTTCVIGPGKSVDIDAVNNVTLNSQSGSIILAQQVASSHEVLLVDTGAIAATTGGGTGWPLVYVDSSDDPAWEKTSATCTLGTTGACSVFSANFIHNCVCNANLNTLTVATILADGPIGCTFTNSGGGNFGGTVAVQTALNTAVAATVVNVSCE